MTLPHRPAAQNTRASSDAPAIPRPECQEVLINCWEYLDGNASSELISRIDAHLALCPPCLRFWLLQDRFFASLAELRERSPAPRRVHHRVRTALATERQTSWPA